MVTIWHRVRKGVSGIGDTEWALLLFETVGIVLGVLLAVQVGTWIEDRKEAREQRELVERLFEESQMAIPIIRGQIGFFERPKERQVEALDQLINRGSCPGRSGWGALANTQFFPPLNPPSTAYDEMVGAGGLGRLRDPQVRNAVSTFHGGLAQFTQQQEFFRSINVEEGALFNDKFPLSFDPETAEVGIGDEGYDALCEDDEIRMHMLSAFRSSHVLNSAREELMSAAIRMCVLLGDEVGRECVPTFGEPLTQEQIAAARGQDRESE
ncbi:hypothetical protein [Altererythrobacter sp. MF3-039]|uniref:hypothetical protein n=1 Tax=Altererythrobacter sp. MF3-039 TaxID=3252901 RepID=UPI00390C77A7